MKKPYKKIFLYFLLFLAAIVAFVTWANLHVEGKAKNHTYNKAADVSAADVALVLGTSRKLINGHNNLYFEYRIKAAVELFKSGKVKHLLVSGDNHIKGYDEPEDMRQALIASGVPDSCITLDYAGFRTLDSIIRCWKVFGQTNFIVVSQEFHNERAVFLASYYGLNISAYNAQNVDNYYGLRTQIREYFARVKAILDVYVLKKKPKFLGEPVQIKL